MIRRIYKYPEKFASRCDRVLTGNTAPIVSITLMEASKLLVAIDLRGCVCVWDPCTHRVSLTVRYSPLSPVVYDFDLPYLTELLSFSDTSGRPAFVGSFPYALVQRCHVVDSVDGPSKTTVSTGKKPNTHSTATTVVSVARLRIPMQLPEAYPISRTALNKAFEMDHKFKVIDRDQHWIFK